MLLWLTHWLSHYYRFFNVFDYLTFRTILGALTSLAISLCVGPMMIRYLSRYQIGQMVRTDGPQSHLSKSGTPTMGGTLILIAISLSTLLWGDLSNIYLWVTLLVTLGFGVIGFIDDYRKIVYRNPKGLSGRKKLFYQSLIAIFVGLVLCYVLNSAQQSYLF